MASELASMGLGAAEQPESVVAIVELGSAEQLPSQVLLTIGVSIGLGAGAGLGAVAQVPSLLTTGVVASV